MVFLFDVPTPVSCRAKSPIDRPKNPIDRMRPFRPFIFSLLCLFRRRFYLRAWLSSVLLDRSPWTPASSNSAASSELELNIAVSAIVAMVSAPTQTHAPIDDIHQCWLICRVGVMDGGRMGGPSAPVFWNIDELKGPNLCLLNLTSVTLWGN